jgi:hypothetical protein
VTKDVIDPEDKNLVSISACKANEYAGCSKEGGAFTIVWVKNLRKYE